MFLPFQWLLYQNMNVNHFCLVCFCIKGTLNCLTPPTGWRSTPTMDEFPQSPFWTESLPMLKITSTMPHLWPLTTVGATVFVRVYMQRQLRSSDSIDFSCREKLQPSKLAEIYAYPHIHVNDHTNNTCKLILNFYALTFFGLFFEAASPSPSNTHICTYTTRCVKESTEVC